MTVGRGVMNLEHTIVLKMVTNYHRHSGDGMVIGNLCSLKVKLMMMVGSMLLIFLREFVYCHSLFF